MRTLLIASVLLLSTACSRAGTTRPDSVVTPPAPHAPLPEGWTSSLSREHPLVGRIWDVKAARFVDLDTLRQSLTAAHFVVLGERHDQPDHHRLQAQLVQGIAASGRKPALAFEMLDVGQQAAVDTSLAKAPGDADALSTAVNWGGSGWPDWALYRPVFASGLEAGLPIVAANLPRSQVRDLVMRGPESMAPELRQRLGLETPLPEAVEQAMLEEQEEAHCGHLPKEMLGPMVQAQRARDAQLADRMLSADTGQGVVLITGNGHARTDRAVPAQLAKRAPGKDVRALALLEVSEELLKPEDYVASLGTETLPFDYAWFTPAVPMEDPCAALRQRTPK
ncbi:Lipoprotein, putative [Myxococcus hansupus]|uniref:Lipoprotein, putative n=1 Tax=Pseudomyxococcus hansupus TaxID=1297742 RepID=A0A0H4WP41_9BACT|nr:ChaN family lipoprotein [Myxococcus hansupus]AKQ64524.1 Lipoprotein, putative [Myxococcus hansupus]